ncbi:hypothetical protein pb186bvf_001122 [Paramecium bursaria]
MNKQLEKDEKGQTIMNARNIAIICDKNGLYSSPELNEILYLHFKGRFEKIQNLDPFVNLCALWLNNNGIAKIEGLDKLVKLNSLFLNNNMIKKIENLDNLVNIQTLNLSCNSIYEVENLSYLIKLQNLNLSNNHLSEFDTLKGLLDCPQVTNLDLSQNHIEFDERILFEILSKIQLNCLYLKGNEIIRGFPYYRRQFTISIVNLQFLDDKPVTQADRRIAEAWAKGGNEAEKQERIKVEQEKRESQHKQFLSSQKIVEDGELKKKEFFEINQERLCKDIRELQILIDNDPSQDLQKQLEMKEQELRNLESTAKHMVFVPESQARCFSIVEEDNGNIIVTNKQGAEADEIINKFYSKEIREYNKTDKDRQKEIQKQLYQNQIDELIRQDELNEQLEGVVDHNQTNKDWIMEPKENEKDKQSKEYQKLRKGWKKDHDELLENLVKYHKFDFESVSNEFKKVMMLEDQELEYLEPEDLRKVWTYIELVKYRDQEPIIHDLDQLD